MTTAIPLKRLGKPEEAVWTVLFLASDEASFITGQTLVIGRVQTLPDESMKAILYPLRQTSEQRNFLRRFPTTH